MKFELVPERIAGDRRQEDPQVVVLRRDLLVLRQDSSLGGLKQAVQATQHRERQDDPPVLGLAECAAKEFGRFPDHFGKVGLADAGLGGGLSCLIFVVAHSGCAVWDAVAVAEISARSTFSGAGVKCAMSTSKVSTPMRCSSAVMLSIDPNRRTPPRVLPNIAAAAPMWTCNS